MLWNSSTENDIWLCEYLEREVSRESLASRMRVTWYILGGEGIRVRLCNVPVSPYTLMVTACFGIKIIIATKECLLSFECSISYFSRGIYFYFPGGNLNSVLGSHQCSGKQK